MYINVKRQFLYRMIYAMKFYWVRCWVMGKATVRCHFEIDLSFYLSFLLYYYDFVIIIFFFWIFYYPIILSPSLWLTVNLLLIDFMMDKLCL